jgi:hypothetical protein
MKRAGGRCQSPPTLKPTTGAHLRRPFPGGSAPKAEQIRRKSNVQAREQGLKARERSCSARKSTGFARHDVIADGASVRVNLPPPPRYKPQSGGPRRGKSHASDSPAERKSVRLPRCLERRLGRRRPRKPRPVKLTICHDCGNATRTVRGHCSVCLERKTN